MTRWIRVATLLAATALTATSVRAQGTEPEGAPGEKPALIESAPPTPALPMPSAAPSIPSAAASVPSAAASVPSAAASVPSAAVSVPLEPQTLSVAPDAPLEAPPLPPEDSVRETPAPAVAAAEPAKPEVQATPRSGRRVFVRFAPLAIAANGRPLGGNEYSWFPDVFGLGVGGLFTPKLDFFFSATTQRPIPKNDDFGAIYGRFSAAYRPALTAAGSPVDLYVYGGGGFGGVGNYVRIKDTCVDESVVKCGRYYERFGGDVHVGVGLDFTLKVLRFNSGQSMYLFGGLDARATVFFNSSPASLVNFFAVYSVPVGLRWD